MKGQQENAGEYIPDTYWKRTWKIVETQICVSTPHLYTTTYNLSHQRLSTPSSVAVRCSTSISIPWGKPPASTLAVCSLLVSDVLQRVATFFCVCGIVGDGEYNHSLYQSGPYLRSVETLQGWLRAVFSAGNYGCFQNKPCFFGFRDRRESILTYLPKNPWVNADPWVNGKEPLGKWQRTLG